MKVMVFFSPKNVMIEQNDDTVFTAVVVYMQAMAETAIATTPVALWAWSEKD